MARRRRAKARASIAVGASMLAAVATAQAFPPTGTVVAGLSAEHVVRGHEDGPIEQLWRVEISAHGTRVTSLGLAEGEPYPGAVQMLAHNAGERLWMIDRARRIVHRVPLAPGPADDAPSADAGPAAPSRVFAFAPCDGLHAGEPEASSWRGRAVRVHACSDDGGRVISHDSFDAEAGIVVRVVVPDGPVHEVRRIRAVALGPERFVPHESLREVGLEELLGGPAPLARYEDD